MDKLTSIKAEAVKIAKILNRLRKAIADAEGPSSTSKAISFSEMAGDPIRGAGEPAPTSKADEAFEEAIRFWAMRVAELLDSAQWDEMVEHARRSVPDFSGDVIRFYENAFEGLALRDGNVIYP